MSNLPIKKETGFFGKIKLFFRSLFFKNEIVLESQNEEYIRKDIIENNQKENFENNIKVEVSEEYTKDTKRNEFIKQIEENPNLLYNLPLEKIEKISEYYKDLVKKEEEENIKLKAELAKLKKVS